MTTNQATYAAILAMDGVPARRIDRLRERVGSGLQTLNSRHNHAGAADKSRALAAHRELYLLADTRGTDPRGLHPGDVIYWVACLGGACLLLVLATT